MTTSKIVIKEDSKSLERFTARIGRKYLAIEGWKEKNKFGFEVGNLNFKLLLKVKSSQVPSNLSFVVFRDLLTKEIPCRVKLLYVDLSSKNIEIEFGLWVVDFDRDSHINPYQYLKRIKQLSKNHYFKVSALELRNNIDDHFIALRLKSSFTKDVTHT